MNNKPALLKDVRLKDVRLKDVRFAKAKAGITCGVPNDDTGVCSRPATKTWNWNFSSTPPGQSATMSLCKKHHKGAVKLFEIIKLIKSC